MTQYAPPFGTYTATNDTNCRELARLLGCTMAADGTYVMLDTCPVPDFNKIQPYMRDKIIRELSAMVTAT